MRKLRSVLLMCVFIVSVAVCASLPEAGATPWYGWGGDSTRNSVLSGVTPVNHGLASSRSLDNILPDTWGTGWSPVGAGSPVVHDNKAYVYAQQGSTWSITDGAIFAIDLVSGDYVWGTSVGAPQMSSWSSPALDTATGRIIIGSDGGPHVHCLDAASGAVQWQTMLDKAVVNASAVAGSGKAFITDYNGFGTDCFLYAINNDPSDAVPDGTIDWQYPIGGASGATPTYHDGMVYVASINDGTGGTGWPNSRGQVYAFNAATGVKSWQTALPNDSSVGNPFGGLSYRNGSLCIGTYEFYGDHQSAGLYTLNAATGAIESSALTNRSSSIPVVWERSDGGGEVVISSGGIHGFGSVSTVQFFDEATGTFLGSTALADDGWAGNWTYQPLVVNDILYIGGPEAEWFGPSDHLMAIDLDAIDWAAAATTPFEMPITDPAVIADLGPGSSPAYYNGMLVTYGPGGLFQTYGELFTVVIPEPTTLVLLCVGIAALAWYRRRRAG